MEFRRYNNLVGNKDFRRKLRKSLTPPEARLWIHIKSSQLGCKFRRQHGVGKYVLDFYCPEFNLALEIDGSNHDNPISYDYDKLRAEYLNSKNIEVIRFTNKEIMNNLEGVLIEIKKHLTLPSALGGHLPLAGKEN